MVLLVNNKQMEDDTKTLFRDSLRTFKDIHRTLQEDWILAQFQRLTESIQEIDCMYYERLCFVVVYLEIYVSLLL